MRSISIVLKAEVSDDREREMREELRVMDSPEARRDLVDGYHATGSNLLRRPAEPQAHAYLHRPWILLESEARSLAP